MTVPVFDAYHAWLGIPSKYRPLNYYRLLGLELYEANLDVIEGAADRQMGHVRQYQSGEHAVDAARILNELATARLSLLKPTTKAAYDAKLRRELDPHSPESPQSSAGDFDLRSLAQNKTKGPPTLPEFSSAPSLSSATAGSGLPDFSSSENLRPKSPPSNPMRSTFLTASIGAVVCCVIVAATLFSRNGNAPKATTIVERNPNRANIASQQTTKPEALVTEATAVPEPQPQVVPDLTEDVISPTTSEIAMPVVTPVPIPAASAATPDKPTTVADGWINLLEWAEYADWAPRGIAWNDRLEGQPTKNGISLKSMEYNRYPLPGIIDGNYELEAEFTRYEGSDAVVMFFPVGNHSLQLILSGLNGSIGGVNWIDGKNALDPNSGNPTTRRPSKFGNNQRHYIRIRVRRDGEQAAFTIDFDEAKEFIKWEGPYSSLWNVDGSQWKLHMIRHVWLGSFLNRTTFHKVRVRMESGEIRRDTITAADREEDLEKGFVRLIGEQATLPVVGWGRFLVNQYPCGAPSADFTERVWPLIPHEFRVCQDFYGAHSPSRLKCPIPPGAKSFSVVGYNDSSRATRFMIYADSKQLYDSGVSDIVPIKVNLTPKALLLELVVDVAGDNRMDRSYWCYPRFHRVAADQIADGAIDGREGPLKFKIESSSVGFGKLTRNVPIEQTVAVPLHFRDAVPCDEFLFSHANSSVSYAIPEGMKRFTAIAYNVRSHHVKYEVWADAKQIYAGPTAGIHPIDVKLPNGAKSIELKINDLGNFAYDFSMWCYPRLHRK